MKFVAWNIRQGGGTRVVQITDHLLEQNGEVLILSEFRNNNAGHFIRAKLLTEGFTYQYQSSVDPKKNGVLIASKIACNFFMFQQQIKDFPEAIICAEYAHFKLWGLYLPHKKKHTLFPFLLEQIKLGGAHILMGDFNTGINYVDQKGSSFWYSEYLGKLKDLNLADAFRYHAGGVKEFSWVSHQGNGYRYDHCWLSDQLLEQSGDCAFDHLARESGLSDHSLMYLKLFEKD